MSIASPTATATSNTSPASSATTTTTSGTPIRLPSISELTSRSNTSPRLSVSDSAKFLPSISATASSANITSPYKYQPTKPTNQSNYILHNANTTTSSSTSNSVNSLPKITSPALPPQQQLPPASSISPVTRLINTPPQQSVSASTSPNTHHQYHQYPPQPQPQPTTQQSPLIHAQQQQYPQPAYYQQPVYYQGAPAPVMAIHHQQPQAPQQSAYPHLHSHPAPEVVNKPINKCHRCGTTETPEWRRGPKGVRTLCNACGLFHAKLVKRKGAALAAEEVLNNKVTKGKNGRRISIKKHLLNESLKNTNVVHAAVPAGVPQYYAPPQHQQQQHPMAVQVMGKQPLGITLPPPVHYNNGMMIPPQPQPQVIPVYQNGQIPLIRH
ncbi:Biofilm regulator 1 [Candida viswanathii]|uniref:Biofilm regulator 1 n=1 Tax=Candida viswanathii TaxID=5486 RepID=A0A367XSF4_9ASCO|nr:Biofilm regulator 1 [Candida viswanathii]